MPEAITQRKNRRNAQPRLPFDRRLVCIAGCCICLRRTASRSWAIRCEIPLMKGLTKKTFHVSITY